MSGSRKNHRRVIRRCPFLLVSMQASNLNVEEMLWDTLQTVTLLPCQLEHDERIFFFKRFQLLYGNLCTAITRSFRSGTEQPTVSAWKKKEFSVRRSDPLLWLFLMTFWFASRRLFTGLRGSSSFRIVLLLSLDCNIKRMHPAF